MGEGGTLGFVLLGVCLYIGLLGGCATPPVMEIVAAESTINQAEEAGAPRYAPDSFKSAQEALSKARELSAGWEYQEAGYWAQESKQRAEKSRNEALATQERFKKEAVDSLKEAEKALSQPDKTPEATPLGREPELAKETIKRAKIALDLNNYEEARDLALLAKRQAQGLVEAAKKMDAEAAKQAEKQERIKRERRSLGELNQGITSYKVKPGETLWMIAAYPEIYSDSLLWPIIYKANRDQIRDPEVIFANQILKIPRNITEEQRDTAIKESSEGTWFKPK